MFRLRSGKQRNRQTLFKRRVQDANACLVPFLFSTSFCENRYQDTVGTLVRSDHKGISNQYVSDDKCIVNEVNLIRRLTPLECECLQGFPDGWTNIPSASNSARYKVLGNSVAIPCVEFIIKGGYISQI